LTIVLATNWTEKMVKTLSCRMYCWIIHRSMITDAGTNWKKLQFKKNSKKNNRNNYFLQYRIILNSI
jgi:hypothetical protein